MYVYYILYKCVFVLPQAGRSSKRQLFLFPGGIERHVKIKTCSVSVYPLLSTTGYHHQTLFVEHFKTTTVDQSAVKKNK